MYLRMRARLCGLLYRVLIRHEHFANRSRCLGYPMRRTLPRGLGYPALNRIARRLRGAALFDRGGAGRTAARARNALVRRCARLQPHKQTNNKPRGRRRR